MSEINISDMLAMQKELWEVNKEKWSPLEPKYARNSLLWMIGEIGEVIDIIKKCGEESILHNKDTKEAFVEEMADVLMYYNDVLLRCGITGGELSEAYIKKFNKNINRSFDMEAEKFEQNLSEK